MDINKVLVIGRLTRDADKKVSNSGMAFVGFSIANGYRKKNGDQWADETNYFECVILGKSAESVFPYLKKGRQVAIDGELRQNRWESNGQKMSKVVILANTLQLLSEPRQQEAKPEVKQETPKTNGPESFVDTEEDIPF